MLQFARDSGPQPGDAGSQELRCCAASRRPARQGASESDLNLGWLQCDLEEGTPLHWSRHPAHPTAFLHVLTEVAHAAVRTRLLLTDLPDREELWPTALGNRGGNPADLRETDLRAS